MTTTTILFGDEGRNKVLHGARLVADAVRRTLGPRPRSVLIGKRWGDPAVCDDGVTIARTVNLADREEQLGVQMMRQAAARTADRVGDGTTTSILLTYAMFSEGVRNVVAGANPIELRQGLDRGLAAVVDALKGFAQPVRSRAEKAQVATVSAHGDASIGELVADAVERVGAEGVVSVEEAQSTESSLEVVEGMLLDRGYLSPYFITNPARQEVVLDDAYLLLHDRRIGSMTDLVGLLELIVREGRPVLLVAEDVEGEALATLVINRLRGSLACAAIKAPGFGERRKALLDDLAILTGGG